MPWHVILLDTWFFWIVMVVPLIFTIILVDAEIYGWTLIVLGLWVAFTQAFTNVDIWAWIVNNPWSIFWGVIGYFVCGTLWGVGKWTMYCHDQLEVWEEKKTRAQDSWKNSGTSKSWKDYVREFYSYPPSPLEYKVEISGWMTFWPFSMIWFLLNRPVQWVWKYIRIGLTNLLTGISNWIFAGKI